MPRHKPEIRILAERALVLEWPPAADHVQHRDILAVCDHLLGLGHAAICDVVPAFHTLTVLLEPDHEPGEALHLLESQIDRLYTEESLLTQAHERRAAPEVIQIPVRYGGQDGPDMEGFARDRGLTPREVIAFHTSVDYYVFMIGFAAGFPYLGGLPEVLHSPRRDSPRIRVPAGSVGIGGSQTGIYPVEAPGGWHLLGRTEVVLFDPSSDRPALLQAGDRVRFVEVAG
jgi:KipI family sensor histidine kinase inhibitor